MTLDDLIDACKVCGGSGKAVEETPQRSAGGLGVHRVTYSLTDNCPACWGTGRGALTPTGNAIKDFLEVLKKKHLL